MSDQEFLHGAIHGSLLAVISKPHRGYWALLAAAWIWAIWSCAEYWREIDIALSRKDLSSDPVVVEAFRARLIRAQHSSLDARMHWNQALAPGWQ